MVSPVVQEPRMLKDFLADNSNSCSSITFGNFTARKYLFFQENLSTTFSNKTLSKFLIKYLPFSSIKPPSILPRSISRRLYNKSIRNARRNDDVKEISNKVMVKDILRWRSFRDLAEEQSQPLDFSSSPHHCTTVTTTTGSTSTAPSSSRSSWCDSDFTAEDLPLWCGDTNECEGENKVHEGKKQLSIGPVDRDSLKVNPKGEWPCEEKEQSSPVSVLDFSFEEDDESFSYFVQSPTYLEPKKRQRKGLFVNKNVINEDETNDVEAKTKQLLYVAKAIEIPETYEDLLLLDFFREELCSSNNKKCDAFDNELLKVAKAWIDGEDDGCLEWKMVGKREFSVKDMERGVKWSKFEEEKQELGLEIQNALLNYLVDELLVEFVNR